jgi:hypothetical protein
MDGRKFTALYTLQDGLPGDPEEFCGLLHGDVAVRSLFNETSSKLDVHPDTPGRARGNLLAGDEAICKPAMKGGRSQSEYLSGLLHCDKFPVLRGGGRIESGDFPVAAQISDFVCGESIPSGGSSTLSIDNTCDDAIRVMNGQAADKFDGILVCADRCVVVTLEGRSSSETAPPFHRIMRMISEGCSIRCPWVDRFFTWSLSRLRDSRS